MLSLPTDGQLLNANCSVFGALPVVWNNETSFDYRF